ncbi:hypothetical protein D3C85_1853970 [compost metagenome]
MDVDLPELSKGFDQIAPGLDQLIDNDLLAFLQHLDIQAATRSRKHLLPVIINDLPILG